MNKKNVICISIMMLIIGSSYKIKALYGFADNEVEPSGQAYDVCEDCENNAYPGDTYTRLVISGENENGEKQEPVELILCNETQKNQLGDICDITVSDDVIPNPVNGDMTTNEDYHIAVNEYFEETITNGEFTNTVTANGIAKIYCNSDSMTDECSDKLKKTIAERRANGEDDPFDVNGYPGAVLNNDNSQMKDSYKDDLCARNTPGVNGFLCENLNGACKAGSNTSYEGANNSSGTVLKGTIGICTYDSTNKLDAITTCSDFCTKNSDLENCNMCCKENNGKPYYDSSNPACNSDDEPEPDTPDDGECFIPKTICDTNPSLCTGYDDKLPSSNISGGSCDSNYSSDVYEMTGSFADSCNLVPIIKHTIVDINYPSSINQTIYAGQGFNWYGGFSGTATITLLQGNTSKLLAAINQLDSAKTKLEAKMNCDIESAKESARESYNNCMDSCDCSNESDTKDPTTEKSPKDQCEERLSSCQGECEYPDYEEIEQSIRESYSSAFKTIEQEIQKFENCMSQASNYKTTTTTDRNAASTYSNIMKLDNGYTQSSNSVKYIDKNNGLPLTKISKNAFENKYNFFVPSNIKNGIKGDLVATGSSPYVGSLNATCPMKISNYFMCNGNDCEAGGIAVIYRPISLTDPFPDTINGEEYRKRLGYWGENSPDVFIKNNRDTSDYDVYNLTPMYDITLTPTDIKKIRKYNKANSFSDFNLECENGLYCKSNFLRNSDYSYIVNISNSCAMGSDWYACDTEKMGNTRDIMLEKLKK